MMSQNLNKRFDNTLEASADVTAQRFWSTKSEFLLFVKAAIFFIFMGLS